MSPFPLSLTIDCPAWVAEVAAAAEFYPTDEDRVRLAIRLARENVERGDGGPFGAAIFESATGRLIAAGVNRVVPANNAALHAEVMAIMLAQHRLGSFTLSGTPCDLAASCDPCAMCLGVTLWSGVKRLLCGASRDDAEALGFEEGPVFSESFAYLQQRGITIAREVLRAEARSVLQLYRDTGGVVYNP